ncbi:sensor histidine kinase [Anaeromyxobacter soli]|uniref:sensor histidine kinase n=1 Tax=Anaeromyxobacter soli TaxID=2922725 RepID=UPI001FAED013|nr:HAMP domain-containing sensor histidine kinase [Anaeromyxobacter sp. SG29]
MARLGPLAFLVLALGTVAVGAGAFGMLSQAATLDAVVSAELAPIHGELRSIAPALARAHDEALEAARTKLAASIHNASRALLAAAAVALALAAGAFAVARRSVRALARSEARYRAAFENAAIGIAHVALDGRWLRVNRRYAEILGYTEDELCALRFQDMTHPEDVGENEAHGRRLVTGEDETYTVEKRYLRRDGRATWVNLTVALVRDGAGRPRSFISVAEPIDRRKAVEDELRDALRARDEFLAVASHELRTPLTSLRLQLEGLKLAAARGAASPERIAASSGAALRQQARLARLVDELLDVSRLDRGELRIAPREADLAEVVRVAAERLGDAASRAGSTVRLELPDAMPARIDPDEVERAVGHVLANALKYGAGKPVDVELERRGEAGLLVVRDRGIGVDPSVRERIFDRFERAVSPRNFGGLGLGLFVARRVIEAHGGRIAVEDSAGEGATFRIELPLAGPVALEADARGSASAG